jgi:hypothetical protein
MFDALRKYTAHETLFKINHALRARLRPQSEDRAHTVTTASEFAVGAAPRVGLRTARQVRRHAGRVAPNRLPFPLRISAPNAVPLGLPATTPLGEQRGIGPIRNDGPHRSTRRCQPLSLRPRTIRFDHDSPTVIDRFPITRPLRDIRWRDPCTSSSPRPSTVADLDFS